MARRKIDDVFTQRGRAGFSSVKPMQLEMMPRYQPPPEEEDGMMGSIGKALGAMIPGIAGGVKGKDKGNVDNPLGSGRNIDPRTQSNTVADDGSIVPRGLVSGSSTPSEQAKYVGDYEDAVNAPIEKKAGWKDALYKGAVILSNMFNPQNQIAVTGLGRAQYNRDVGRAKGVYDQNREIDVAKQQDEMRQAQIEGARQKPILDKQKLDLQRTRVENDFLTKQANYDRLVKAEEGRNTRAGNQTKIQEVDGYLFRAYPNDPSKQLEPIMDPRTGKQAFNPANVAQEITFEDGTKAWAKGGQIVSGKFAGERQAKQQEFAGQQNDKDRALRREQFLMSYDQKIADDVRAMANDTVKRAQWVTEQTRNIQKDLADGKLDNDTANAMLEALGKYK